MPTWVSFLLENVVLAIFTGIVTSFLFLAVLFRFKPRIEISPKIAYGISTNTKEKIYRIKVINRTGAKGVRAKGVRPSYFNY